ncbi:hypothetical protein CLAIMM_14868 [Cladophialophora immunda]|nr:hypothetical protein CLAIMM_14868 [Cladophialophora immunda]
MSRDPFQAALLDDFQIGHSMSRSLLKRISNVFGLGDNDRCLDAVEKCLEVLNLNHQVEEITSLQLVASEDARETQHSLETDLRNRYQDTCTRCLRSFSFSAMGVREANIVPPLQDTCEWIYNTTAYCTLGHQSHQYAVD